MTILVSVEVELFTGDAFGGQRKFLNCSSITSCETFVKVLPCQRDISHRRIGTVQHGIFEGKRIARRSRRARPRCGRQPGDDQGVSVDHPGFSGLDLVRSTASVSARSGEAFVKIPVG